MIRKLIKKIIYKHKASSESYINYCRQGGAKIGKRCIIYDPRNTNIDETSLKFIEMGDDVQITQGCVILAHDYSYSVCHCMGELPRVQAVTKIGSNVFIGMNSIILMRANIGDNVIIGAGSIVHGKLESNSVYVGNPAKCICSLEEFSNKNKERVIDSAKVYALQLQKQYNRVPEISEMGFYTVLFVDKNQENLHRYFSNSSNLDCIKKIPKQFETVEELLEKG